MEMNPSADRCIEKQRKKPTFPKATIISLFACQCSFSYFVLFFVFVIVIIIIIIIIIYFFVFCLVSLTAIFTIYRFFHYIFSTQT